VKQDRPLSQPERDLLAHLLGLSPATQAYLDQLDRVRVTGRCDCGCPSIGLAVVGAQRAPGSLSSPVVDAEAESPAGEAVGVLVFAADGQLTQLEVYSFSGEACTLPTVDGIGWVAPPVA
jgi:hypothetical protein